MSTPLYLIWSSYLLWCLHRIWMWVPYVYISGYIRHIPDWFTEHQIGSQICLIGVSIPWIGLNGQYLTESLHNNSHSCHVDKLNIFWAWEPLDHCGHGAYYLDYNSDMTRLLDRDTQISLHSWWTYLLQRCGYHNQPCRLFIFHSSLTTVSTLLHPSRFLIPHWVSVVRTPL